MNTLELLAAVRVRLEPAGSTVLVGESSSSPLAPAEAASGAATHRLCHRQSDDLVELSNEKVCLRASMEVWAALLEARRTPADSLLDASLIVEGELGALKSLLALLFVGRDEASPSVRRPSSVVDARKASGR